MFLLVPKRHISQHLTAKVAISKLELKIKTSSLDGIQIYLCSLNICKKTDNKEKTLNSV